ncbi:MAG: DUF1501 domain-containing protein [Gemmataceae bacterium]
MNLPARSCPGPLTRRSFLKLGSLALGGFSATHVLPWQLQAAESSKAASDRAVIFIWLPGGPPHMETYDMKPDAPEEYRGAFKPIKTNVPGIDICELLPRQAKVADRFTIIRSVAHKFADHGGGHKRFLTGRDPQEPTGFVNDYPMVGSMVSEVVKQRRRGVPNYIAGVDRGRHGIDVFSFGSAYLGTSSHPFMVAGDPSEKNFKVQNLAATAEQTAGLRQRMQLLKDVERVPGGLDAAEVATLDGFQDRALYLLTSDAAREAFDLSAETPALRDRYGMHRFGQRALMARRLVEAGATFVSMVMENPTPPGGRMPKDCCYNWDSHAVNCHLFNDAKWRFPYYDQAVAALIEDLYDRGLDRKVLLIVTGEFGRTPRVSYSNGTQTNMKQPGRDHWPSAMSMLVSGGGMRTGQIVGSTNARGEHPKDRPLTPNDLWATMFKHLAIDYDNTMFIDHGGRPMPILPFGTPIAELL